MLFSGGGAVDMVKLSSAILIQIAIIRSAW
jgi:hypothetical protein